MLIYSKRFEQKLPAKFLLKLTLIDWFDLIRRRTAHKLERLARKIDTRS